MRIAFVQEEMSVYLSFAYLSSVAKEIGGHVVDVFIKNCDESYLKEIMKFKPEIICFSTTTPNYQFAKKTSVKLKKIFPKSFILMGGCHPTYYPEMFEREKSFDAICRGEGEIPFRKFLEAYPDLDLIKKIPNFHIRIGNKIYKNPICNLIEDLDSIPIADHSLYFDKYEILRKQLTKTMITRRGCPYPCTHCFNMTSKKIYSGKGKYVRLRSPGNIIEEIKQIRSKYRLECILFRDGTFNHDKDWLYSFLEKYQREVKLPFIAGYRIENLNEDLIRKLKNAGAEKISFGIEHGNENYRKTILKKDIKNSVIIKNTRLLKKYNIRFHTTNMTGLPEETLDLAFETLKLNQKIQPDFAQMFVFQPYPGTALYDYAKKRGLTENFDINELTGHTLWGTNLTKVSSVIKNKDINQMINLSSFFYFLIKYPWMTQFVKLFLSFPPNKYFDFINTWFITKLKIKYSANYKEKINYILKLSRNVFPSYLQKYLEKALKYNTIN